MFSAHTLREGCGYTNMNTTTITRFFSNMWPDLRKPGKYIIMAMGNFSITGHEKWDIDTSRVD